MPGPLKQAIECDVPVAELSDSLTAKRRAALSLPPEIMLLVARFASDNDLERLLHPERRWVPWAASSSDCRAAVVGGGSDTSPALSVYESSEYVPSRSESLSSDVHVDVCDVQSASSGARSGSQPPSTPPLALECDPAWEGRSVEALSLVSREWNAVAAEYLFSTLARASITNHTLLPLLQNFVPRHRHIVRQLDLSHIPGFKVIILFETLLAVVAHFPKITSLIIGVDAFDSYLPMARVTPILELLADKVTHLTLLGHDIPSLIRHTSLMPPEYVQNVTRIDLPALNLFDLDGRELALDAARRNWRTFLNRFLRLQRIVIGVDSESNTSLNPALASRRRAVAFASPLRMDELRGGGPRTSIDLHSGYQLLRRDFQHIEVLSEHLWSLTIGPHSLGGGRDHSTSRLAESYLPLMGPFPRLAVLSLRDIETRTDEEIHLADNELWVAPDDSESPLNDPRPPRPVTTSLSRGVVFADGTSYTTQDNAHIYFLLLSSFGNSPLNTISLSGAHLFNILRHRSFLPFLRRHLPELTQLIIKAGDTVEGGRTHLMLEKFCVEHGLRLAFEGARSVGDTLDVVGATSA